MKRLRLIVIMSAFLALVPSVRKAVAESSPLTSDFNKDSAVDNLDLKAWNADFGTVSGNNGSVVDGNAFLSWQRDLGNGGANQEAEISHNPEPATIVVWGVIVVGAGATVALRRRRQIGA